jgi:hypothetical protein
MQGLCEAGADAGIGLEAWLSLGVAFFKRERGPINSAQTYETHYILSYNIASKPSMRWGLCYGHLGKGEKAVTVSGYWLTANHNRLAIIKNMETA